MFTGIIQKIGTVKKIAASAGLTTLTIEAALQNKKIGDSIAVDGACLTLTNLSDSSFSVEIMPETLNRTIIKNYKAGSRVNLEHPLRIGDTLDGHFVQGHVDFVGTVQNFSPGKVLNVRLPPEYKKFFAEKGSVSLNGVSLTVSKVTNDAFEVSLIPETLKNTNLAELKPGDTINVETDLISRYLLQK